MRCVVQRVKSASVTVDGTLISNIGRGLCVLVGISCEDTPEGLEWMAKKLTNGNACTNTFL
jgi:D-tyrosyl-tRNA(Tyr) deacylase